MAAPSYTHTLTNGTTADASQVMQNFNDLLNGVTDGTKDLTIAGLTCSGNVSFQGNVTLGNGSVDDLTVSASLATSIPIKTNNSFDIGSATLGLAGVYLGAAGGFTTRLKSAATASWTLTFPSGAGSAGQKLANSGSGSTAWANSGSTAVENSALSASVGANALTVALKGADGNDPSATNPVYITFRNATATTGTPVVRTVTGTLSMTVTADATLGHTSGMDQYVWVYALDNAGTVELAVSGVKLFSDGSIQSTSGVGTGSDDGSTLYSTTTRANVPIRLLGRLKSNQTAAGTWATAISEITVDSKPVFNASDWTTYTPSSTQGFGTVSASEFQWRRVGDSIELQAKFTAGTVAASEARISLPAAPTALTVSTKVTSQRVFGPYGASTGLGSTYFGNGNITANGGNAYVNFGKAADGVGGAADGGQDGNLIVGTGGKVSFFCTLPVQGWSSYGP